MLDKESIRGQIQNRFNHKVYNTNLNEELLTPAIIGAVATMSVSVGKWVYDSYTVYRGSDAILQFITRYDRTDVIIEKLPKLQRMLKAAKTREALDGVLHFSDEILRDIVGLEGKVDTFVDVVYKHHAIDLMVYHNPARTKMKIREFIQQTVDKVKAIKNEVNTVIILA